MFRTVVLILSHKLAVYQLTPFTVRAGYASFALQFRPVGRPAGLWWRAGWSGLVGKATVMNAVEHYTRNLGISFDIIAVGLLLWCWSHRHNAH